jgi:hypothetical protein
LASDNKKTKKPSTRTIENLFAKFAAIYGVKFADQWAGINHDAVKATWEQGLADLRRDEIVAGIQRLILCGKPFPPTLPEFYVMCRPRVDVPPEKDHDALDDMARKHGISTVGCASYHALRARIVERLAPNNAALRALEKK